MVKARRKDAPAVLPATSTNTPTTTVTATATTPSDVDWPWVKPMSLFLGLEPPLPPGGAATPASIISVWRIQRGQAHATAILDEIVDGAWAVLHQHDLESRVFPHAAVSCANAVRSTLQMLNLQRDEGEVDDDPSWLADDDPPRVDPDAWARGVVPVHWEAAPEPPPVSNAPKELDRMSARGSVWGRRSVRRSGTFTSPPIAGSVASTQPKPQKGRPAPPPTRPTPQPVQMTLAEQARARQEREKQRLDESWKRLEDERVAEDAKAEKIQREARGKEYSYARDGVTVVHIVRPNPSKLPSHVIVPRVAVSGGGGVAPVAPVAESQAKAPKLLRGRSGAPHAEAKQTLFKPKPGMDVNLLATMRVAPGVVLRGGSGSGSATMAGPPVGSPGGGRMSRAEYAQLASRATKAM